MHHDNDQLMPFNKHAFQVGIGEHLFQVIMQKHSSIDHQIIFFGRGESKLKILDLIGKL